MRRQLPVVIALLTLICVAAAPAIGAHPDQTFTSEKDVSYHVSIDTENYTLSVEMTNPTSHQVNATYLVLIDNRTQIFYSAEIGPGDSRTTQVGFQEGIDVQRDNHSVSVSTFEGNATFQFHRNLSLLHPGKVPVPYISSVRVVNGSTHTAPHQNTTVLAVTVRNPSKRGYPLYLMANTLGTKGTGWIPRVGTSASDTVTVALDEDRGIRTAGEVRLYAQPPDGPRYPIDQVGFVGEAGNETEWWNESYEQVRPPWKNDSYQYTNQSLGWWQSEPTLSERVGSNASVIAAVLVALVGVVVGYRRLS